MNQITEKREPLISAHEIYSYIHLQNDTFVHCVDGVDLEIYEGEVFGLVGESGSGKTMLALSMMGLMDKYPGLVHGKVVYTGSRKKKNILISENGQLHKPETLKPSLKEYRAKLRKQNHRYKALWGHYLSLIFQDPQTSLNPYLKIGQQLGEAIRKSYPQLSKDEVKKKALSWLRQVRIRDPEEEIESYPHQLSGGMGQRVMIALALASNPKFVVADEPTTGLDVTIQSKIVDLFRQIKDDLGITFLLISHDLGMISQLSDRIGVMYCGKMMEVGPVEDILNFDQRHPYTSGLLNSLPDLGQRYQENKLSVIPEDVPSSTDPPSGCRFHPRCQARLNRLKSDKNEIFELCDEKEPPFFKVRKNHFIRCWLYKDRPLDEK